MASFTVPCPKTFFGSTVRISNQRELKKQTNKVSFCPGSNPTPSVFLGSSLGDPSPKWKQSTAWKVHAQLNEVTVEKSSNSAPVLPTQSEVASSEGKDGLAEPVQDTVPDISTISAFMSQVSDLVKLVDSRDITELQLKQLDCEIIIRKKEALQQPSPAPAPAGPYAYMPPPLTNAAYPSPSPPALAATPGPASAPSAAAPALPAPAKTSTSSHPPLKCPMAGTFYRCPGPGEPPFVKVGDKIQKGQVVCIIEAMKLMNEIEADQSGTVTEVLLEDRKPVSVDTPLFVIVP